MEVCMACSVTFTVWPTRRQFQVNVTKDFQEFERIYQSAHLEAAIVSASYSVETYITIEQSLERCTFKSEEYLNPRSPLRIIMSSGTIRSYWSFETRSWYPLPLDLEVDEGYIIARRMLPPPKKPV